MQRGINIALVVRVGRKAWAYGTKNVTHLERILPTIKRGGKKTF